MDDREASQYFDRFASTRPEDRDFDNESMSEGATQYLGQLPDNDFEQAATNAFMRTPAPQQRGLLGSLLGGLQNRGVDLGSLQSQLGLGGTNPSQMGPNDYARLAGYTRRNHPEILREQVREQPALLKAMGNPIVMGALGMVAANLLRKRR